MGTYELDDDQVRQLLRNPERLPRALATMLETQVPQPTPLGVGAIVRTEHPNIGGLFLRWAPDNATHSPWIAVGNHEDPYRTDEIGRITEVLTPGMIL